MTPYEVLEGGWLKFEDKDGNRLLIPPGVDTVVSIKEITEEVR